VIGPIIATQAFGPLLGSDPQLKGPKGRIVMISSVAGKNGNPLTSAYAASKHAIEGLSESLRRELMLFGIDVIVVAPGAVKLRSGARPRKSTFPCTRTHLISGAAKDSAPSCCIWVRSDCRRRKIAEKVFEALTAASPKVRYTIVPDPMRQMVMGLLPKRTVDKIVAKRLGSRRSDEHDAENVDRGRGGPCVRVGRLCRRPGRSRTNSATATPSRWSNASRPRRRNGTAIEHRLPEGGAGAVPAQRDPLRTAHGCGSSIGDVQCLSHCAVLALRHSTIWKVLPSQNCSGSPWSPAKAADANARTATAPINILSIMLIAAA